MENFMPLSVAEAAIVIDECKDFSSIFDFRYENGLVIGRRQSTRMQCVMSKNVLTLTVSPISIAVAYESPREIVSLLGFLLASMAKSTEIYSMIGRIGAAVAAMTVNYKIEELIKKENERKE